jgi:hypothetical protein
MVQKGKLAACALALERQLNNVDLPTLGSPTIPAFISYITPLFIISFSYYYILYYLVVFRRATRRDALSLAS